MGWIYRRAQVDCRRRLGAPLRRDLARSSGFSQPRAREAVEQLRKISGPRRQSARRDRGTSPRRAVAALVVGGIDRLVLRHDRFNALTI